MSRCAVQFTGDGLDISVSADNALDLIEWIYLKYPPQALKILRQRIIFETEPSLFEQALIKVAAKRWAVGRLAQGLEPTDMGALESMRNENLKLSRKMFAGEIGKTFDDLQTAGKWVAQMAESTVVAATFDKDWRLLAATRNTNSQIRTRHAEINLLDVSDCKSAAHLVVSLQSCRMCAAALPQRKIYYLKPEPALANVKTSLFGFEEKI